MKFFFLAQLAVASSAITALLFYIRRAQFTFYPLSILFIYILLSGLTDVSTTAMSFFHISNINAINIFYLLQFMLLVSFLLNQFKNKIFILICISSATAIAVYSILDIYNNFSLLKIAVQSISMQGVCLSLVSILALLSKTFKTNMMLTLDPMFWFISAILIYFSLSTLAFVTAEIQLENVDSIRKYTWMINAFATILSNVLYLLGLRCLKNQLKSSLPSI